MRFFLVHVIFVLLNLPSLQGRVILHAPPDSVQAWEEFQDSLGFLTPSPTFHKTKFSLALGAQVVGYGGSLALLSTAWYNDYDKTSFHSFDDSPEWLQMDKAGHFITAWYLGRMGAGMYEWSGVNKKKAVLYGALSGWAYLTAIEVMDGFSKGWGFSWSDISANTLGTGFIVAQKFLENRYTYTAIGKKVMSPVATGIIGISLKFSFHQTNWPGFRPSLLGTTFSENIIKDYNGQTYWLSFNLSSFCKFENKFPKWINVALGYGAEGMISGRPGYAYTYPNGNTVEFERSRQYYLSLDIDLTRIKTKSRLLKTVFEVLSFIKIPAPSLEVNKKGIKFHPLYY